VEGRIQQLDAMLRTAKVIDNHDGPADEIAVGSSVRVKDLASGEQITYTIVGSLEADPDQARISNESPVGRALLGHRAGETVDVVVPAGKIRYSILKIAH
jgi:transcription elongation factor GreA